MVTKKTKEQAPAPSYYDRTIAAIKKQAAVRGIVELDGVKAELEKQFGRLIELSDAELRRLNQQLPAFFAEYLGGRKRRGDVEPAPRQEWDPTADA